MRWGIYTQRNSSLTSTELERKRIKNGMGHDEDALSILGITSTEIA